MENKFNPLSSEQLTQLAAMQDHLNQLTCQANFGHTDWKSMDFNWGLAIIDEVMEIHGHLGWKWWKGSDKYQVGLTPENKKQVQLEVIDILHFGLSKSIQENNFPKTALSCTIDIVAALNWIVEDISAYSLSLQWQAFNGLCQAVDLSAEEIMEIYTGKYALNIFRQDHGYGEGTYCKNWLIPEVSVSFQEDNWYLEQAIEAVKEAGQQVTVLAITMYLETWYKLATGGGK